MANDDDERVQSAEDILLALDCEREQRLDGLSFVPARIVTKRQPGGIREQRLFEVDIPDGLNCEIASDVPIVHRDGHVQIGSVTIININGTTLFCAIMPVDCGVSGAVECGFRASNRGFTPVIVVC